MRSFRSKPVGWQHDNYRHYLAAKYGSARKRYFGVFENMEGMRVEDADFEGSGQSMAEWKLAEKNRENRFRMRKNEAYNTMLDEVDPAMVREVSEKIEGMNQYGSHREVDVDRDSVELIWSNASGEWQPTWQVYPKGTVVKLDANQTLLPVVQQRGNEISVREHTKAEAIGKILPVHPLYNLSSEARERGHAPSDVSERWFEKQKELKDKMIEGILDDVKDHIDERKYGEYGGK